MIIIIGLVSAVVVAALGIGFFMANGSRKDSKTDGAVRVREGERRG